MSFTVVVCNEGHRIHAAHRLAGKTLPCPKCGVPVTVPEAKTDPLSDTAVLRILGDSTASTQAAAAADEPTTRACPKCSVQIGLYLSVCPFCHCYAGAVSDYWEKMLGDAAPSKRKLA
jgi:ssDNA-binding Zn-finger/Zn-ribbon topoisomerase 1